MRWCGFLGRLSSSAESHKEDQEQPKQKFIKGESFVGLEVAAKSAFSAGLVFSISGVVATCLRTTVGVGILFIRIFAVALAKFAALVFLHTADVCAKVVSALAVDRVAKLTFGAGYRFALVFHAFASLPALFAGEAAILTFFALHPITRILFTFSVVAKFVFSTKNICT